MIEALTTGVILISDPFLKDPNFLRTAVIICEHNAEGSVGFVFNKQFELGIGDLVEGLEGINFPVYEEPFKKTASTLYILAPIL